MSKESFCLTWNEFEKSTTNTFNLLREEKEYSDVALFSDDGEIFNAHKVVLNAVSPFLKKIISRTPQHQTTWIYLGGLQNCEIEALLDFIYLGETKVDSENLKAFLDIGSKWKLKGMADVEEIEEHLVNNIVGSAKEVTPAGLIKDEIVATLNEVLDDKSEQIQEEQSKDSNQFVCETCNYITKTSAMLKIHVDAKHRNVKYKCEMCDFTSGYRHHVYRHKKTKHTL